MQNGREPIRLPDLELWAGPREIELEIELPKGSKLDGLDESTLTMICDEPTILGCGEARFEPDSLRFMIPVTAVHEGRVTVNYRLTVNYRNKAGEVVQHTATLVQLIDVLNRGGATVPWLHYRVQ